MEQTWLDEDTALKAAASKGVGGSSPSCSAIFKPNHLNLAPKAQRIQCSYEN